MAEDAASELERWAQQAEYTPNRRPHVVEDWLAAHPDRLEQVRVAREQKGWAWSAILRFLKAQADFPFTENPLQNAARKLGIL